MRVHPQLLVSFARQTRHQPHFVLCRGHMCSLPAAPATVPTRRDLHQPAPSRSDQGQPSTRSSAMQLGVLGPGHILSGSRVLQLPLATPQGAQAAAQHAVAQYTAVHVVASVQQLQWHGKISSVGWQPAQCTHLGVCILGPVRTCIVVCCNPPAPVLAPCCCCCCCPQASMLARPAGAPAALRLGT
jgi:hypothetical protein